jgi:hypothetical protein
MPTSLQSRTQYLALAEFCQSVIAGLMDFIDGGASTATSALRSRLREAHQSFEAISSGQLHALARPTSTTPFGTFEQVRTLQEVWDDAQLGTAVRLIKRLLAPSAKQQKLESAQRLIELFSKLQTKALWNFRQPRQALPRSFRELCRAL